MKVPTMKTYLASLALLASVVPALAAPHTVTLSVPGMDCAVCPITIKKALMKLDGVAGVTSSLEKRETNVLFDDSKVNAAALTRATKEAGFPSTVANAKR